MSRPILDKHVQASVASWKTRLRAQPWGMGRIDEDVGRLATLLALDLDTPTSGPSRRAKEAVVELRVAILQTEQEAADADVVDLLASWIRTRLLVDGDRLLISKERRQKLLAQGRDEERRQGKTSRGLRSARIELPEETWRQLRELQANLAPEGKRLTQNHAVMLLVGDRFKAARPSALPVKNTRTAKPATRNATPLKMPDSAPTLETAKKGLTFDLNGGESKSRATGYQGTLFEPVADPPVPEDEPTK